MTVLFQHPINIEPPFRTPWPLISKFLCHIEKELLFSNKETIILFSLVSNKVNVVDFVECFWSLSFGASSALGSTGLCLLPSLEVSAIVSQYFSPMVFPHPNCLETSLLLARPGTDRMSLGGLQREPQSVLGPAHKTGHSVVDL